MRLFLRSGPGERVCDVEAAALLLRSPIDAQWEMITHDGRSPLRSAVGSDNDQQNLAQWLLAQERPLVLNKLDRDPRFVLGSVSPTQEIGSLLARPLRSEDHTLLGVLILLNQSREEFLPRGLHALDELITRSQKTLEQAELYTQTDQTMMQPDQALAAIQRAAREINSTLDPKQVAWHTLHCALEIIDGKAGFVALDGRGLSCLVEVEGVSLTAEQAQQLATKSRDLGHWLERAKSFCLPSLLFRRFQATLASALLLPSGL